MSHANQILVTIAVKDNKLFVYPRREDDTAIYCNSQDPTLPPQSPDKPREICWVATGASPSQEIRITAGHPHGKPVFAHSTWTIPGGTNGAYVESGFVKNPPAEGFYAVCKYDIELLDGGKRVDYIDPTVVIKTDP